MARRGAVNGSTRLIAIGLLTATLASAVACAGASTAPSDVSFEGFTLTGDPAAANGATWTYRATDGGITYDLQGILYKPATAGLLPAAIISHGAGGNVNGYSRAIAREMVSWGLVCIATNYTHAGGVAIGSPGTAADSGASAANVQRARRLVEILRHLGYVDMNRIALHGHSMGAFVTAATAGAHPTLFRAASHTAGGIAPNSSLTVFAPTDAQIAGIRAPYQMHHGDRDLVVLLAADQLFAAALLSRGVTHELITYPGADHDDVSVNTTVLGRIREWYRTYGVL